MLFKQWSAHDGFHMLGTQPNGEHPQELLEWVQHLQGVQRITTLADFAVKGREAADSWVVESKDYLVPALADEEVNCGIGLLHTGLTVDGVSREEMKGLLRRVWQTMKTSEEHALTKNEIANVFLHGLDYLRLKGWIVQEQQARFELGGRTLPWQEAAQIDLDAVVPPQVRRTKAARYPTRMEVKGNHFLELQVVDSVIDAPRARDMGLQKGHLVLMVHLGHLVTRYVNFHFFLRESFLARPLSRRALYTASKALFHFGHPRSWAKVGERWHLYFAGRGLEVPIESPEGNRYMTAHALSANYGYVARAMVYCICLESIRRLFGATIQPHLLCDTTHESIRVHPSSSGQVVIVRKGAVECFPGRPAIVAGSYDVPSLLGECMGSPMTASSYDHGSANFRQAAQYPEEPASMALSQCIRYKAHLPEKGQPTLRESEASVHSPGPMEELAHLLQVNGAVKPVAWLRPVANFTEE